MKARILITLLVCSTLHAGTEDQEKVSNFLSGVKSAPKEATGFLKGIGESFGMTPGSEYNLSYEVYNDTSVSIYAGKRFVANVQGANIWKDIDVKMLIAPYSNSGKTFYNMQQRFSMVVDYDLSMNKDTNKYTNKIDKATRESRSADVVILERNEVTLGDPSQEGYSDPYIIRTYQRHEVVKAEFLGQRTTTTYFIGVFYNNSDKVTTLDFMKDGASCKVGLDPHSFNLLNSSDEPNSIRPPDANQKRNFVFTGGASATLSIPPTGFIGGPYTYEIYNNQVNIQGINVGNYDVVPVDAQGKNVPDRARDINPVPCSFWLRSAEQAKKGAEQPESLFDEPYPIWVSYKTKDQILYKKLRLGEVSNFLVMRPRLEEKEAWIYVVLMKTISDDQVKKFFDRLYAGQIPGQKEVIMGASSKSESSASLTIQGLLDDRQPNGSGAFGYLLLADVFFPLGLGASPFYYTFEPAVLGVEQLASMMLPYLNSAYFKSDNERPENLMLKDLLTQIKGWIKGYVTGEVRTRSDDFKNYLLAKGIDRLFRNPKASPSARTFNEYGEKIFQRLLTGPISIANYPVLRYAGTNNFSNEPEGIQGVTVRKYLLG